MSAGATGLPANPIRPWPDRSNVRAMGFLDTVKGWFGGSKSKVQDTVASQSDNINKGIEKTGDVIDDKTGGKYADKVDSGQQAAEGAVDKLKGDAGSS